MPVNICIVEDDRTIREKVSLALKKAGYEVTDFADGSHLLHQKNISHDLYILDVLLPKVSGTEICNHLRGLSPAVPILFLSALSSAEDRIEGLKSGADDYLTKPFEMQELLLRVERMCQRTEWFQASLLGNAVYKWSNNEVNFKTFEAKCGREASHLGYKECMILKLLVEKKNEVVTRDEILNQIWGYDAFPTARTVDNFILKLRKTFETNPSEPVYIQSVRGIGYKFIER